MKKWEWFLVMIGVSLLIPTFYFVYREIPPEQPRLIGDLVLNLALLYGGFVIPITSIYRIYRDWRYGTKRETQRESEAGG